MAWWDLPNATGRAKRCTTGFGGGRATARWLLVAKVRVIAEAVAELDREVSVDSTIVRAHQHSAGGRAQVVHTGRNGSGGEHSEQVLLSVVPQVGPSTKIHLACDGLGRPLSVLLTAGNFNDCTMFTQVLAGIRMPRPGRGRPWTRPRRVLADKGYSTRAIRRY
ncbi:transposase, partial [Nocardia sp. NPDC019302]|uniref:transposase n=1 Tax=Nocardia sp. NPDC019302 TaxID=3154592 RepID=UPI0034018523